MVSSEKNWLQFWTISKGKCVLTRDSDHVDTILTPQAPRFFEGWCFNNFQCIVIVSTVSIVHNRRTRLVLMVIVQSTFEWLNDSMYASYHRVLTKPITCIIANTVRVARIAIQSFHLSHLSKEKDQRKGYNDGHVDVQGRKDNSCHGTVSQNRASPWWWILTASLAMLSNPVPAYFFLKKKKKKNSFEKKFYIFSMMRSDFSIP